MIVPLRLSFEVACAPEHAFQVWTSHIDRWWPRDHTVTGETNLQVVLQGHVGGRIYERTAAGIEHDWGQVTEWDPPERLSYRWHLRQDTGDATEVEVRFVPDGDATRVEIEHRGWERLGPSAEERRGQNYAGWSSLLPYFVVAAHTPLPTTQPSPNGAL